jgi:hypothetical protein
MIDIILVLVGRPRVKIKGDFIHVLLRLFIKLVQYFTGGIVAVLIL